MDPDSPVDQNLDFPEFSEKAFIGRRLLRRARRGVPGKFDGDGDGFVYNPVTGRDDLPAPKRSLIPRKGKKKRRVLFNEPQKRQTTMMRSRWTDDDSDPLDELNRSLGIGVPNAADRMTAAAREMAERRRQQGAGFSPVAVDRKKVRVNGVSRNTFLSLMDDLIDYTKNLKDNPVEERDNKRIWKLLFVMQKLENLDGLTQAGDAVDLNISEDELKRLYKGLQSLIDNLDVWSDNTDAQDLYKQIAKLYKRGWGNIADAKSDLTNDLEFKVLGARLGRRARRAIRKVTGRSRIDGDGDGFRTDPLTGEDDIPIVDAPDLPTPKKPKLSVSDVGMMSMRTRGGLYRTTRSRGAAQKFRSRKFRSEDSDPISGLFASIANLFSEPRNDAEAVEWIKEGLNKVSPVNGKPEIKDRSWDIFEKRVKSINDEIEERFGKFVDLEDFEDAFLELNPNVIISGFSDDPRPEEIGFLKGLLWMMHKFPNRFDRSSRIEINKEGTRPEGGAGTGVSARFRGRYGNKPTKVRPGERVIFEFYGHEDIHRDKTVPPLSYMDGVTSQLQKAYLNSRGDSEDPSKVLSTAHELQGLGTGIHEGAHALHHLAAAEDALLDNMTPDEIDQAIQDFIDNNPDEIYDTFIAMAGHESLYDILYAVVNLSMEGPDAEDEMIRVMRELQSAGETDAATEVAQAIQGRRAAIQRVGELMDVLNNSGPNKYSNIKAALAGMNVGNSKELEQFVGKLILENKNETVELLTALAAAEEGISPAAYRQAFRNSPAEFAAAEFQIVRTKLWDDLNSAEISALRGIWKYVSKYAKDKHSIYGGQTLGASVEGAAEATLLRLMGFGLPPDKVSPQAMAALDKWLKWMAGKDY